MDAKERVFRENDDVSVFRPQLGVFLGLHVVRQRGPLWSLVVVISTPDALCVCIWEYCDKIDLSTRQSQIETKLCCDEKPPCFRVPLLLQTCTHAKPMSSFLCREASQRRRQYQGRPDSNIYRALKWANRTTVFEGGSIRPNGFSYGTMRPLFSGFVCPLALCRLQKQTGVLCRAFANLVTWRSLCRV